MRPASLSATIILLFFCALLPVAAQVTPTLFPPPPNQLRISDLWRATLTNTTGEPIEIYLEGRVTESRDGEIVHARSRSFTLPPGVTRLRGPQLEPIEVITSKEPYRSIVTRTGVVPTGEYTICVFVFRASDGEELGSDCIDHTVENLSPPVLIAPDDRSTLGEPLPLFTWSPPVPLPSTRDGVTYTLRIAEILGRQSAYDALRSNPPFFERRSIRSLTFQYPVAAREFVSGKRYAWRIAAIDSRGVELGESEVWSFTGGTHLLISAVEAAELPLVASLAGMKADAVIGGKSGSGAIVESSGGGKSAGSLSRLSAGAAAAAENTVGQLWTWGNNQMAQLGTGAVPTTSRPTPKAVDALDKTRDAAFGAEHGLALLSNGSVRAWGNNDYGQLGTGNQDRSTTPKSVPGLTNVIDVAAGNYHSMALRSDGKVWTWGYNRSGELGREKQEDQLEPGQVNISGVVAIAAGDGHSLALDSQGKVWGWGTNRNGQAVPAADADAVVTRPVQIEGLPKAIAIAAGSGFSMALLEDGTIRTWGTNNSGQLGNGAADPDAKYVEKMILGRLSAGTGSGGGGKTGATRLATRASKPGGIKMLELGLVAVNTTGIVSVSGLTGAVAIDAGGAHAVALRRDSTAWSWGNNYWGALGSGDRAFRRGPGRVNGLDDAIAVAAGADHTLGIAATRTLYAWGNNTHGQLGRADGAESEGDANWSVDPAVVTK